MPHRLSEIGHFNDTHAVGGRTGIRRHEGMGESEANGFGKPAPDAVNPTDLARQPHFTDNDQACVQRLVGGCAGDGERDGKIAGRLGEFHGPGQYGRGAAAHASNRWVDVYGGASGD